MTDEKELGRAIKRGDDTIEITGDLKEKVVKIKVTGKVAWLVCIGAIGVAITSIVVTAGSGGVASVPSALISMPALAGAVGILGGSTTITAVTIAIVGGGVGALNKLRGYRIEKISDEKIILHKR